MHIEEKKMYYKLSDLNFHLKKLNKEMQRN